MSCGIRDRLFLLCSHLFHAGTSLLFFLMNRLNPSSYVSGDLSHYGQGVSREPSLVRGRKEDRVGCV
jgi:hypothetical protein